MYSSDEHKKMDGSHQMNGDRLVHLGEMAVAWDVIGNDRCLKSDTEIASFLLRYYEDTCMGHQSAAHCTHCHTLLVLLCPKCISAKSHEPEIDKYAQPIQAGVDTSTVSQHQFNTSAPPPTSAGSVQEDIDIPQLPSVDINLPDMMETTSDSQVLSSAVDIPGLMTPEHSSFQRDTGSVTEMGYTTVNTASRSGMGSDPQAMSVSDDQSELESNTQSNSRSVCPHCHSEFFHPVGLTRHLNLQICYTKTDLPPVMDMPPEKVFKCTLCTSVFFEPDLLTKHMNVHAGHMPFKCSECGAGFLKSSVLDLHMQKHRGRYTCRSCKAEFANATGLTRHVKSTDCVSSEFYQEKISTSVYAAENTSYSEQVPKEKEKPHTANIWGEEPQGKFECDRCGKRWSNQCSLDRHMLTHTGQRAYACQECGTTFLQQCHLVNHVRRKHIAGKPIRCGKCGMTFVSESGLEKHSCQPKVAAPPLSQLRFHPAKRGRPPKNKPIARIASSATSGIASSKVSGKSDSVSDAPTSQRASVDPSPDSRPHKCRYCGAEFAFASDLTTHLQKHTGQKEFRCLHCDAAFMKPHNLTRHMRKHSVPQQVCNYCGMTFATSTQLTVHIRMHTGETPFKCEICQAAFREKRNYKIHLRIHTGEKPYLCEDCGRSFSQVNNYRRHTRIHTGERPYACQQCPRTFADKSNLTHHLRMHAGIKPHECSQCGKFFRETYSLKVHMRSHTKEKPYKCSQCGSAFSMDSSLTKHMRIHTGEKPYECPICGRKFANPSNRAAHVRTHKRLDSIEVTRH